VGTKAVNEEESRRRDEEIMFMMMDRGGDKNIYQSKRL
jgi:hypothetical protein